jgi:uncharacterized protein (TIGR00730 family)
LSESASAKHILVFCASSRSCDPIYHEVAARLGRILARASMTIVYGGGAEGSMGALADAALAAGGEVVGIQPRFMRELEWSHGRLTALHVVEDMQERKRRMLACADAVVALPGGSGTLEELLEAITAKRLGMFLKPIILVNQLSFFDPCVRMLERCIEERFMDARHREMWQIVDEPEQVLDAIEAAAAWSESARHFAAI